MENKRVRVKVACSFEGLCSHIWDTISQVQSTQLALEDSRKKVEEQLAQTQKKLEATIETSKGLHDQLQAATEAQEKSALQVKSVFHTINVPSRYLSTHFMRPCSQVAE